MATKHHDEDEGGDGAEQLQTHLRGAADALRHHDHASARAHAAGFFGALSDALAAESTGAGGEAPAGLADKAAAHEHAARLDELAAEAGAAGLDWAAIWAVVQQVLPLLEKLIVRK